MLSLASKCGGLLRCLLPQMLTLRRSAMAEGWQLEHLSTAMGTSMKRSTSMVDCVATHPLQVRSAYTEVAGAEPAFTTCHGKALKTVDFQWYTPHSRSLALQPLRILNAPPLEGFHPLPTDLYPSDHICLVVDYGLMLRTQQ